jgi:hypothetical protein
VRLPPILFIALVACSERAPEAAPAALLTPPEVRDVEGTPAAVVLPRGPVRPDEAVTEDTRVHAAAEDDVDYRGDQRVEAMRLVYRVTFRVPAMLGEVPTTMPRATAELHIDVSWDRLRARFSGPGWPVVPGSEVRLRRDLGGVYIFDGDGGRPAGPGMLAQWFQGGPMDRRQTPAVGILRAPASEQSVPGDLICALLAEWSGQPRTELERRCGEGGAPLVFRIGSWRAERTAEVPVEIARHELRADDADSPPPLTATSSRAFMEQSVLARIPLARRPRRGEVLPTPDAELLIDNQGPTRVVVTVGGIPIGWVDQGATGRFVGFVPGEHVVGAMRPLGNLAVHPRPRTLPGEVRIPPRRPNAP